MNTYTYRANGVVIYRHHGNQADAEKEFRLRFGKKQALCDLCKASRARQPC
jgi:hypothetical protein